VSFRPQTVSTKCAYGDSGGKEWGGQKKKKGGLKGGKNFGLRREPRHHGSAENAKRWWGQEKKKSAAQEGRAPERPASLPKCLAAKGRKMKGMVLALAVQGGGPQRLTSFCAVALSGEAEALLLCGGGLSGPGKGDQPARGGKK